jgi:adenylate cyclase
MHKEIERKFLVKGEFRGKSYGKNRIVQGYLSSVPERTVRVRISNKRGFITIKGKSDITGLTRFEWEKEIPFNEAKALMRLCEPSIIDKTRYLVRNGRHTFEVDEFHGDNKGLIIAEIELQSENEEFEKPDWLGEEVTGQENYYNVMLSKNPFKDW